MNTITHQSLADAGSYRDFSITGADSGVVKKLHRFMLRLRQCEEALSREYHPADEMRCPVHFCIGQEAVPAALSLVLGQDDYLFCHHRSHGYYLAKDAPMRELFAELYGKKTGANGGIAGSQDISYAPRNFFSGAILGGAAAISVGTALSAQLRKNPAVTVAGFGESAMDEGIMWEAVSYAALCRLPLVFICENNKYSVFSPQLKRQAADNLSERAAAFGVKSVALFGNDVIKAHAAVKRAVDDAHNGGGPWFIEAYTYRWCGHYGPESDDIIGYRSEQEVEFWKANCPIALLEAEMKRNGLLTEAAKAEMIREIDAEIADAFRFAKSSDFPTIADWRALNLNPASPRADQLLADIDFAEPAFNPNQSVAQPKGY
ncbi:MAG TPA: thiamine pyrophosphate-dependent dehydrogenase E1 component subunit alpha [Burkholderiales bacterium]|nr:thiamine pyrophosphate-dependent dehydrogenase E1 component subunit alpha [Burkholderiales bacterium]